MKIWWKIRNSSLLSLETLRDIFEHSVQMKSMKVSPKFSRTQALDFESFPVDFSLTTHFEPLSNISSDISVTQRKAFGEKTSWMENYSIILFSVLLEIGKVRCAAEKLSDGKSVILEPRDDVIRISVLSWN